MAKYVVNSPIKSGGKIHAIGASIVLDDAIAAPLLATGRIETIAKKNSNVSAESTPVSGDGAQQAPESRVPETDSAANPPAKKPGAKK